MEQRAQAQQQFYPTPGAPCRGWVRRAHMRSRSLHSENMRPHTWSRWSCEDINPSIAEEAKPMRSGRPPKSGNSESWSGDRLFIDGSADRALKPPSPALRRSFSPTADRGRITAYPSVTTWEATRNRPASSGRIDTHNSCSARSSKRIFPPRLNEAGSAELQLDRSRLRSRRNAH